MDSYLDHSEFYDPPRGTALKGWDKGLNRLLYKYGISMFGLTSIFSVTEQTIKKWLYYENEPNTSNANFIVTIDYLLDNPDEVTKSMKNMNLIRNETLWQTSMKLLSESKEIIDKESYLKVNKSTRISFASSLINIANLLREAMSINEEWLRKNLFLVAVLAQGLKQGR